MTLVHAETGEVLTDADVIEEFTEDEARAFVGRINASLHITGEMIIEAYDRRIWKSLGYRTWDDFTQLELGGPAMNPAQRAVLAVGLREAGMSLRAIASATGASHEQIRRDVAGVTNVTPQITGQDGKQYAATQPGRAAGADDREASGDPASIDSDPAAPCSDTGETADREAVDPPSAPTSPVSPIDPRSEHPTAGEPIQVDPRDRLITGAAKAVVKSYELFMFDADELAAVNDPDLDRSIRELMGTIAPWWEAYKQAKPKGLVAIPGGKQ